MTEQEYQRNSDTDGFTVVYRTGRAARIHLLRPYNSCNTERSKSGRNTYRVEGGRENLLMALKGKRATECRRCFPSPHKKLEPNVIEPVYAEEEDYS